MAVDPFEFRTIVGHFASGVTIITSAEGDLLHGMTANAVASLSLDPVMLLICVDKTAYSHESIAQAGAFGVNILAEHQEAVSRLFAKHSEPESGSLRGQPYRIGDTGAPLLADCLAYMECRVKDVVEGGDHSIFLGEVVDQAVVNSDARPLVFYRGGYHSLAG
ncbi:MAG TPA: flavin reductase family protein [Dehalococcoidia bacterium]|nr:flavin reductase family protein [Dehalococcoidia bacterium]